MDLRLNPNGLVTSPCVAAKYQYNILVILGGIEMEWNFIIDIKEDKTFDIYIDDQLMKTNEVIFDCLDDRMRAYYIKTDDRKLQHAISIVIKNSELYLIANIKEYHSEGNKIYGTFDDNIYKCPKFTYTTDNVQRSSPDGGVELQANGSGKILDLIYSNLI